MQALMLATGETQKLRPITERIPSPMVTLLDRPIMLYNLLLLGRMGFKNILVNVHWLADHIENYFGDGQRWGVSLEYILQRDALGSAGALRWARHRLKDHFIVMPADQVVDLDISQAIRQHLLQKAVATVLVQPGARPGDRSLQVEDGKYICALGSDVSGPQAWTDVGVYIFDPSVLECIPPRQPFDIYQNLLPLLLDQKTELQACLLPGYCNPLDTFQAYQEAQHMFLVRSLKEKNAPGENVFYLYDSLESRQLARWIWSGKNVRIHPGAKILPMVSIGSNSWIGEDVELGPDTIIGSNVVIDEGATIKDSIVLSNSYVGKWVRLENRLVHQDQLVDLNTGEHVQVTDPVLLGRTDPNSILARFRRPLELCLVFLFLLFTLPLSLGLAILLMLTTGRVFTRVACNSPRSSRQSSHPGQLETFDLIHFNTRKADGRSFWLGRWLASWEGQRLPELLNIIKGDLALVGLKPVTTEEEIQIRKAWHLEQGRTPAGFTGQWYLDTDAHSSLDDGVIADAYYLATLSGTRDWRILKGTPSAWLRKVRSRAGK